MIRRAGRENCEVLQVGPAAPFQIGIRKPRERRKERIAAIPEFPALLPRLPRSFRGDRIGIEERPGLFAEAVQVGGDPAALRALHAVPQFRSQWGLEWKPFDKGRTAAIGLDGLRKLAARQVSGAGALGLLGPPREPIPMPCERRRGDKKSPERKR